MGYGKHLSVLIACPPCTGFSRTLPNNHIMDDPRNSLIRRTALFVRALKPNIVVMENVRELIRGKFQHHYEALISDLNDLGYQVNGKIQMLNKLGLPQKRERALIIATKKDFQLRTLEDLWKGFIPKPEATHVWKAIHDLPVVKAGEAHPDDPMHTSPGIGVGNLRRLQAIPHNGGSWANLIKLQDANVLLTPAMKRYVSVGDLGSHPDIYGRLAWHRPAVTIKRECAHIGNGRYAHPEQDRLCTVRELSILQGFPRNYRFVAPGLSNNYRHIGDAVPPLISYQLAHVCQWILNGKRPQIQDALLPLSHLRFEDISEDGEIAHEVQLSLSWDNQVSGKKLLAGTTGQ